MQEISAGILVYRRNKITNGIEVLLGKCRWILLEK